MREHFVTRKVVGNLIFKGKHTFKNVRAEYKYDIYSNKNMEGTFEVDNQIGAKFLNDFQSLNEYEFKGQGISIKGEILGWSFGNGDKLNFDIYEIKEWNLHVHKEPCKLIISYNIPYVSALSRKVKKSWLEDDDYIVKFNGEEFKLFVDEFLISFNEKIALLNHIEPDSIFNRKIYPKIELLIGQTAYAFIEDIVKKLDMILEDSIIIISMLLFKRFNKFGYSISLLDETEALMQQIEHRDTLKNSGSDLMFSDNLEFNKYFKAEYVSSLIITFRNLCAIDKEKYTRIIHSYLSIHEVGIIESKFREVYFLLGAISKLIVNPQDNDPGFESLLNDACIKSGIDLNNVRFRPSEKSKKLKWLISEYRNELIHYNFFTNIKNEMIIEEYYKMLAILRKLMIYYLIPELMNFPLPKQKR